MKGRPIDQIVYECMFPKPKSTDPQNFQGLLQRQLVPEVRLETQAFYGHLSSQEAKYPGLDYSYQPHRVRLSRYPWHRRLFRAFDALHLTKSEIAGLTKWEGTRWAKERFEREQGIIIRDTTSDDIEDWVEPELRGPVVHVPRSTDMNDSQEGDIDEAEGMDEDSDMDLSQSVGIQLNERLRAAVAQREAGNAGTVMDEEWEQWLKDAVEAGGIPFLSPDFGFVDSAPDANIPGTRPIASFSSSREARPHATATAPVSRSTTTMHPRLLNAARLGQWQQIPDFLQHMVRQNLETTNRSTSNSSTNSVSVSAPRHEPSQRAVPPLPSSTSTADVSRSPRTGRRLLRHTPALTFDGESQARG
ncbi:hypothetical protein PVAG01_04337 [Phlyctema vagabunda]|uniref:Nitrogen regulatory protein areA GATA-like domain-containing protein n=1 Tax=Phlyctema vagabunda TaxID=108571 RepID=A0ABR4PNY2_9HELO